MNNKIHKKYNKTNCILSNATPIDDGGIGGP